MTDFDYDCLQRKRLAQQSKYRKRGSRSKKCSLPSDSLTDKQWRERNGEIMSLQLNKPMSWEDFKLLSCDLQKEYITHLIDTYNINSTSLTEMFGVGCRAIKAHFQRENIDIHFSVGHSMTKAQKKSWADFLGIEEQLRDEENVQSTEEIGALVPKMNMTSFSLEFRGDIDIGQIANSLLHILGKNAVGDIQIICNLSQHAS